MSHQDGTADGDATRGGALASIAFVDLAGFTTLNEVHGDEHALDVLDRFVDLVRGALRPGDRLVKTIGDEVLVRFDTPVGAVAFIERLHRSLRATHALPAARAGLATGPVIERDGDVFGTTVNIAARLTNDARPGQVLATRDLVDPARDRGLEVVIEDDRQLRGLRHPVPVVELVLDAPPDDVALDPVCRMLVHRDRAIGPVETADGPRWFCSAACRRAHDTGIDAPAAPA